MIFQVQLHASHFYEWFTKSNTRACIRRIAYLIPNFTQEAKESLCYASALPITSRTTLKRPADCLSSAQVSFLLSLYSMLGSTSVDFAFIAGTSRGLISLELQSHDFASAIGLKKQSLQLSLHLPPRHHVSWISLSKIWKDPLSNHLMFMRKCLKKYTTIQVLSSGPHKPSNKTE